MLCCNEVESKQRYLWLEIYFWLPLNSLKQNSVAQRTKKKWTFWCRPETDQFRVTERLSRSAWATERKEDDSYPTQLELHQLLQPEMQSLGPRRRGSARAWYPSRRPGCRSGRGALDLGATNFPSRWAIKGSELAVCD